VVALGGQAGRRGEQAAGEHEQPGPPHCL
jgi:hypothetical protein